MHKIIILDFGSQYTHLISNRIRRLGVYTEIHPHDYLPSNTEKVSGIILSGGPSGVYEENSPKPNTEIFNLGIPILGLCYGHHLIAQYFNGNVESGKKKEYGFAQLKINNHENIFADLSNEEQVWMSHGDTVTVAPESFKITGSTEDCPIAALANIEKKIFTLQFHPEVTHTKNGLKIISNFVFNICQCQKDWNPKKYTESIISNIKEKVGNKKVFMLVSGGVDSTVAFTLLNKAIGQENVYGLFIDNGLLRLNEFEFVNEAINALGYNNFNSHDASELFIKKLENVYEPEEKRKIIGDTFIDVQKEVLNNQNFNPDEWLLGQGTIYPDTIESKGTKNSDLIKTHHNRVPIIQKLIDEGKVIEPLESLYKDEVREVGLELGLPKDLIWRHPFPGPGLGVRCLCNNSDSDIQNADEINKKINEVCKDLNLTGQIIPVKSVGVQGDSRTYQHPALITGNCDWESLNNLSTKLTNYVHEINRILLLITPNNVNDFELHKNYITNERLDVLKIADDIAMSSIKEHNLLKEIWQMPTIIIPWGKPNEETVILRPVFSTEAMTAEFAKIDINIIKEIAEKIIKTPGISAVLYDITNKPPGTIEWE